MITDTGIDTQAELTKEEQELEEMMGKPFITNGDALNDIRGMTKDDLIEYVKYQEVSWTDVKWIILQINPNSEIEKLFKEGIASQINEWIKKGNNNV